MERKMKERPLRRRMLLVQEGSNQEVDFLHHTHRSS